MAWIKFMGGWDVHGDKQDPIANKVFFDFAEIWKPKIRVCGGDLFDFRPMRKGASADEQRESIQQDFKAGQEWFERFKPQHFIRGNHDERIYDVAQNGTGIAQDFCYEKVGDIEKMVRKHKCRMLPYDKRHNILRIGHLKMLHGFSAGVFATRQTAMVYGSCLFGHIHAIDTHAIPGLERRVAKAVGCLCRLDMDYNSRQPNTLRQAHGFPYGVVNDKTGHYHVWQAEKVGGRWLLATDIVEL
jgi:hypothetical protein